MSFLYYVFFPEPIFPSAHWWELPALSSLFFEFSLHQLHHGQHWKRAYEASSLLTCSNCPIHFLPYESFSHFFTPWKLLISLQFLTLKRTKDHLVVNLIGIPQFLYFLTSCQPSPSGPQLWFLEHFPPDSIHFLLSFYPLFSLGYSFWYYPYQRNR